MQHILTSLLIDNVE